MIYCATFHMYCLLCLNFLPIYHIRYASNCVKKADLRNSKINLTGGATAQTNQAILTLDYLMSVCDGISLRIHIPLV